MKGKHQSIRLYPAEVYIPLKNSNLKRHERNYFFYATSICPCVESGVEKCIHLNLIIRLVLHVAVYRIPSNKCRGKAMISR